MQFSTDRYRVIFYEKIGCSGNERQKKLLTSHGISFQTRSLLDTKWDKESLSSFFTGLEKEEMVNKFAPQVKNRQIDIDTLSKDELIQMMIKEPILIKRPLLQIGSNRICGFDIEKINSCLNSDICESIKISTCLSSDPCVSV
jgi:nitrogenase-associated protein